MPSADSGRAFGMRVLVVDDDADIRRLIQATLLDDDVVTAPDGVVALDMLTYTEVDAVLLDVMMPLLDGFTVLQTIRGDERLADLPVLMVTAKAGDADHARAFRLGADAYLTKPFDITDLEDRITDVLARTPGQRESFRRAELERAELLQRIETTFG